MLRGLDKLLGTKRGLVGQTDGTLERHQTFRTARSYGATPDDQSGGACADARLGHADPWYWRAFLRTDYWNPPTTESQHARQRILAVIVALILAAILAKAGW